MPFYEMLPGGGMPAGLQAGMDSVLNKKLGTATSYPPNGWPDNVNLLGMLEEKTASGTIVTFSDGADEVPLKSCAVTIAPTLTGISAVTVHHTDGQTPPVFSEEYMATLGRTIYGGSVDVVNGLGTDTHNRIDMGSLEWTYHTASGVYSDYFDCYLPNDSILGIASVAFDGVTDDYVSIPSNNIAKGTYTNGVMALANSSRRFIICDTRYTSAEALTTALQGKYLSYPLETPTDFTFAPVPILSRLGDNTLWSVGDMSVVYRASGTVTPVLPRLITKNITANGTYSAEDDNADGYSDVTVNIPTGYANVETVLSSNPLIEVAGVSGTDVSRTMWTYTASASGKIVFHTNTQVKTNTGTNDGYFTVKKNDTVIATTYANTSTTTAFSIPDIDFENGDVITIICGFDNYHTSCWFDIYSTITILTDS